MAAYSLGNGKKMNAAVRADKKESKRKNDAGSIRP
jgi:hypothetical protein